MLRSVAELCQGLVNGLHRLVQILLVEAEGRFDLDDIRVGTVSI